MFVIDEKRKPYFVDRKGKFHPCKVSPEAFLIDFKTEVEKFEYKCMYTHGEIKTLLGTASSLDKSKKVEERPKLKTKRGQSDGNENN